ncbi:hypothetical protein [Flavobacterium hydrophilum]|uniref:DoxX family protein n=1 Tax=Flavobacterium hydrophilum TaxID=2211445 RepID=A0A2V4C816_9FLAO|nr:hypothetical protein [Flavobacterium hydrophilum]PXY46243.1 hypothetical protein DMB68_03405 [Flavobacterium hydrophilum]
MKTTFNFFYFLLSEKIGKHGVNLMRIALATIYIWFGVLKIFGVSPAGDLVEKTVFWFKPELFIPILGICEVCIGTGLLIRKWIPQTILLLLAHMTATLTPIFILQSSCFEIFPYEPTLAGQYIIKNLVLVAGALVISGKYNEDYYAEMNLKKEQEKFAANTPTDNQILNEHI